MRPYKSRHVTQIDTFPCSFHSSLTPSSFLILSILFMHINFQLSIQQILHAKSHTFSTSSRSLLSFIYMKIGEIYSCNNETWLLWITNNKRKNNIDYCICIMQWLVDLISPSEGAWVTTARSHTVLLTVHKSTHLWIRRQTTAESMLLEVINCLW